MAGRELEAAKKEQKEKEGHGSPFQQQSLSE